VFLKTPFDERDGTFSPDGRWVAYQSNESGREEIYIRPFGGGAASGAGATAAGGQWQVYRATDTNLKRQVAIKVLPASLAGETDRLARFQREAEVLAALNHPHIAAIYGLEKTPDFTALVMELVEGDDLSQRIARGAIPIDEALPIATQIAEALEAAHEQGIIHREPEARAYQSAS
jgi:hypothetical protein